MLMAEKTQIQSSEPVTICDQLTVPATEVSTVVVENKIIVLRDTQVILDRDIAELYGVETKVLNQAVKRNINRFPERFMFQLTKDECSRSQFVTMNAGRGYNIEGTTSSIYRMHLQSKALLCCHQFCVPIRQLKSASR
jgi:hypothetical protein